MKKVAPFVGALLVVAGMAAYLIYGYTCEELEDGNKVFANPLRWTIGEKVPKEIFDQAQSLSQGQRLEEGPADDLFFSNVPELPIYTGVLTRVDDVLAPTGVTKALFSHFNMLVNFTTNPLSNYRAKVGLIVTNNTGIPIDVYMRRNAKGVNVDEKDVRLLQDDLAPRNPATNEDIYYGSQLGNKVVHEFFRSVSQGETKVASLRPGEDYYWYEKAGTRAWAIGMAEFVFRDSTSGKILKQGDLPASQGIQMRSFICELSTELKEFSRWASGPETILNQSDYEHIHMRGLISAGINRTYSVKYDARKEGLRSLFLGPGLKDGTDSSVAGTARYKPEMFLNDKVGGIDKYGHIAGQQVKELPVENNGSYGIEYQIEIDAEGPFAIAIQAAGAGYEQFGKPKVDLYNQWMTAKLDDEVRTLTFRDPNYWSYFSDFSKLGPLGTGRVFFAVDQRGHHQHTLSLILPPNNYAPYRVLLMPVSRW
ncbi:hypothetical protein GJ688_13320 [Heliobacillus mobilis]|uniref:Uncharacterized protein n=1 Tax=Heliobacterium mobile TaxID=28064 RepID=A0A6I3SLX9_HELMO|nr:hypothetical protein [Heliobacterium mobile]MTV49954.1 hypothetical protein [Heliobacterium mobile]